MTAATIRRRSDIAEEPDDVDSEGHCAPKDLRLVVFGIDLHRWLPWEVAQMLALAGMAIVSSTLFAVMQEGVLYVPGFKFTGWMSTLTFITYAVCAGLERLQSPPDGPRVGSMQDYIKLSALTMGGMYLTNWSLQYLSYPLRVVFKSSKIIPVMLLSVVYIGKRYSLSQYVSVLCLSVGIVLFALGDSKGKATFHPWGIGIIMIGSFLEALAANFEEKRLFHQLGCTTSEVMLYNSLLGCLWSATADCVQGDFFAALGHSYDHPAAPLLIVAAAAAGYVSMTCILLLIKHFGATMAELVKSCRKILTICTSFILYGKPVTYCHIFGGLLFTASVVVDRAAVGGASRRFAGGLSLVAGAMVLWLLHSSRSPSTYSVIIDAGSTGTRLHVFRFDEWTSHVVNIAGAAQVYEVAEPGLLSFAGNAAGAMASLQPLVDRAMEVVPETMRSSTPLAVRASVGLKALPGNQSRSLLDMAQTAVKAAGFRDWGVEYLDGREESAYTWMSVNFLMRSFRPGVQAVHDPVIVMDLRSVSLQVAHFMDDADAQSALRSDRGSYVRQLKLPYRSGTANIYRHSYLGYGLLKARTKTLKEWATPARQGEAHPCLVPGVRAASHENFTACAELVEHLLDVNASCGGQSSLAHGRCTFAGAWDAPWRGQRVVLISYFYDRLAHAGGVLPHADEATTTPGDFESAAASACAAAAGGKDALAAAYPDATPEVAEWLCFDLAYVTVLLQRGFGLHDDEPLTILQKIQHGGVFDASWPLGLAIERVASSA